MHFGTAERKTFVIQLLNGEGEKKPAKLDLTKIGTKTSRCDCGPVLKIKLNIMKSESTVFIKIYLPFCNY